VEENQLLKILCENCSISVAEIKLGWDRILNQAKDCQSFQEGALHHRVYISAHAFTWMLI
jgi:hypothetical protein